MYERTGYDWRSVGQKLNNDPIPGSPDELERIGREYAHHAQNLGRAAQGLRLLRNRDETCSEAIDAIMEKAAVTASSLENVQERYQTISLALAKYAPELREAQRLSLQAVNQASEAARRKRAAAQRNEQARWSAVTIDEQARNRALQEYHSSKADFEHASGDIASAKALLRQAITKRDEAGQSAQAMIGGEISSSPLNDTVLDHVKEIGKVVFEVGKWVWDNIDVICLVLDVVVIVLSLTGVGAPFAGALKAVLTGVKLLAQGARALAKLKKVVETFSMVSKGFRTGDWGECATTAAVSIVTFLGTKGAGMLGEKGAAWMERAIDKRNLILEQRTKRAVKNVFNEAVMTTDSWKQVSEKVSSTSKLPWYHKGRSALDAMMSSKNVTASSSEAIQTFAGSAALLKGTDFDSVAPYAKELIRLAGTDTISGKAREFLVGTAQRAVENAVGMGTKKVVDFMNGLSPQPTANSVRCVEVGAR